MSRFATFLTAGAALFALAVAAEAADLPTKKKPEASTIPTNCFASFQSWLNASAADCPLSYAGFTLYGSIDLGASYERNAAPFGPKAGNPIEAVIGGQGRGAKFQWTANQLSPTTIGVALKQHLFGDVDLVGDYRIGFNPLSLEVIDYPGTLIANNGVASPFRSTSGASSWNGAFDNNRLWIGFASPTYGSLKVGRFINFFAEKSGLYDADGAAWGFSALGYSGGWFSGFGVTDSNRDNLGVSYVYDYKGIFHIGAQSEIGGFSTLNDAKELWSVDVGGNVQGFSVDGVYQHAVDAIHLTAYNPLTAAQIAAGVNLSQDLRATIANQDGVALLTKYNYQALTLYGVYAWSRLTNPSDASYPSGFSDVIGSRYTVLGDGVPGTITVNAYTRPEVLQSLQLGAKYAFNPQVDLIGTYAHIWQNDFGTAAANNCKAAAAPYVGTVSGGCAGHTDVSTLMVDYRPVKRVDVYGGFVFSHGTGGQVSGYWADSNATFTGGVRVAF